MEFIASGFSVQPVTGKLRDSQIATRDTWAGIPGRTLAQAGAHVIHTVPEGASTVTEVNPVDPGTTAENTPAWLIPPGGMTHIHAAKGRWQ